MASNYHLVAPLILGENDAFLQKESRLSLNV